MVQYLLFVYKHVTWCKSVIRTDKNYSHASRHVDTPDQSSLVTLVQYVVVSSNDCTEREPYSPDKLLIFTVRQR